MNRLAAVQAEPPLRSFATNAPATASSRSASGRTTKGALPPSSMAALTTVREACSRRTRPTSVDPVNDTLRTSGWSSRAELRSLDRVDGTMLTTPSGTPASARIATIASAVSGVSDAGLRMTEHPGRERRSDLAGSHGSGEVPRRDEERDSDRLAQDHDPVRPGGSVLDHAAQAHGFLGVPAKELRGVRDLAPCVRQRLPVLEDDEPSQGLGALGHEVERAAQDLAARPGADRRPRRPAPGVPRRRRSSPRPRCRSRCR